MRPLQTLIAVLLLVMLHSCIDGKAKRSNYAQLRIVLDTNSNFYPDGLRLYAGHKSSIRYRPDYDSSLNLFVYVFDRVEKGNIKLRLLSLLNRTYDRKISLQSDTTIWIMKDELNNFGDADPKNFNSLQLNYHDTMVIGFRSSGCFHFIKESIIISKSKRNYDVVFNTSVLDAYGSPRHLGRTFDSSFVENLDSFYVDCRTLLNLKSACLSTTSTTLLVRMGNTVYHFPDFGCEDWQGYNKLARTIDRP